MVSDFLQNLVSLVRRPNRDNPVLDLAGKVFLYSDADRKYAEVEREDTAHHVPPVTLVDVVGLIDWCKEASLMLSRNEGATGQVVISRSGDTEAVSPMWLENYQEHNRALKTFYRAFMPGQAETASLSYLEVLTWLELVPTMLDQFEVFEAACRTISVMDGRVTKLSSVGAIIKVEGTQESGAQMSGVLPKRLELTMPYGDPGCTIRVTLSLQVVIKSGSPVFCFKHLVSDGSLDAYAAWMRAQLDVLKQDCWVVLVGP